MGYTLDKGLKYARRNVEDVIDEAGDAYEDLRDEVGRRASRAWRNRDEYIDEAVSAAESLGDTVMRRFRDDPVGTFAVGALLVWLAGRLIRR
jgi:hypothetical protein